MSTGAARVSAVLASTAVLVSGCGHRDSAVADRAATRGDGDTLAPIVVETPLAGERVSNPVAVAGTASVFEATLHLRVLDARGRVVGHAWTTATSGAPERGDFSALVSYDLDRTQRGTLEIFEPEAADPPEGDPDGRLNDVRVPVTLVSAFPGIWPATTPAGLAVLQARVDGGKERWRLDPVAVANAYVRERLRLDPPGSSDYIAYDARSGFVDHESSAVPTVVLRRLRPGGVFFVIGADVGGLTVVPRPLRTPLALTARADGRHAAIRVRPSGTITVRLARPGGAWVARATARLRREHAGLVNDHSTAATVSLDVSPAVLSDALVQVLQRDHAGRLERVEEFRLNAGSAPISD